MLQHRIISKLQIPIMRILNPPHSSMFRKLAIINLNLSLSINIFSKLWGVSHGIVIDPEHFQIKILEFLDDLVDFLLEKKVGHEGKGDGVGWELQVGELGQLHVVELELDGLGERLGGGFGLLLVSVLGSL